MLCTVANIKDAQLYESKDSIEKKIHGNIESRNISSSKNRIFQFQDCDRPTIRLTKIGPKINELDYPAIKNAGRSKKCISVIAPKKDFRRMLVGCKLIPGAVEKA